MKDPATSKVQPTNPLDADPRPSGFPYSTLDRPLAGRKRSMGMKPEVQRLWKVIVSEGKGPGKG
jgi:hypothetical protein